MVSQKAMGTDDGGTGVTVPAAAFVDGDALGAYLRRPDVRPKLSPFMQTVLDIQSANLAASKAAARRGWAFLVRTVIAFWLSTLPLPHWAGIALWWAAVTFGFFMLWSWERAWTLRAVSKVWPD